MRKDKKWFVLSIILVAFAFLTGCIPNGDNGEPPYKVGAERLFFCVPEHADSMRIKLFAATADFARIRAVGATMIHTYGIVYLPNQGQGFLDNAQEHQLKVLYSIKSLVHDPLRDGRPWDREECERLVRRFNNHPALWGWYVLDEPDAGIDHPSTGVSMELQKEIYDAFRSWTDKPLVIALRGGTKGWHLIDFSLWKIIADSYVFDGTGECWGMEPLEYLGMVGRQEWDFMEEHEVDFWGFMFQCDNGPAFDAGNYEAKVPLGEIENQFNVLREYNLFPKGLAMYAWSSNGNIDPNRNDEIYEEIKQFFSGLE